MGQRQGLQYESADNTVEIRRILQPGKSGSGIQDIFLVPVPIKPVEASPRGDAPPDGIAAPSTCATAQQPPTGRNFRRLVTCTLVIVAIIATSIYVYRWWTINRFIQSTNDSYLRADQIVMAPRVAGYVSEVLVAENQPVKIGQPLVRIDAERYRAVLAHRHATLDARLADIAVGEAQFQQQVAAVEEAAAKLDGSQLGARFAAREAERYRLLGVMHAESAEKLAQKASNRDQAIVAERSSAAALKAAKRHSETLQAEIGRAFANAQAAEAAIQEADLDIDDSLIRAGTAGQVGDLTVRIGQYVQPGTRLLTIVPIDNIYVVANFKETQIGGLRVGQPASISVDALAGETVHGVLDSFAPGTGAQFALLPPENATGNFTKIVQRVPVRLRIDPDGAMRVRLLPGMSVTVEIDTRNPGTGAEGRR